MTQKVSFSEEFLEIWIQSFPSPRLAATGCYAMLKDSCLPYYLSNIEGRMVIMSTVNQVQTLDEAVCLFSHSANILEKTILSHARGKL